MFIDGCFWHGCPIHYTKPASNTTFWNKKLTRNTERDARVTSELKAMGWHVVRVWEHEIHEDVDRVAIEIRRILQSLTDAA